MIIKFGVCQLKIVLAEKRSVRGRYDVVLTQTTKYPETVMVKRFNTQKQAEDILAEVNVLFKELEHALPKGIDIGIIQTTVGYRLTVYGTTSKMYGRDFNNTDFMGVMKHATEYIKESYKESDTVVVSTTGIEEWFYEA